MANRDVNLTIRAKDQATQVVEALSTALDQLKKSQVGVAKGAQDTQSALGQFGASLNTIQKQISSQSVGTKLAKDFSKAKEAIDRLTTGIEQNRERQTQLALDADKAARKADAERSAVSQLTDELNRQKLILRELSAAKRVADRAVVKSTVEGQAANPQDAAAAARATEALLEQQKAVDALKESLRSAKAAAKDAERDAFKLAESSMAAGRAADAQSADLEKANRALEEYGQEAAQAENRVKELAAAADRSLTQAIGRQVRVVQAARAAYEENSAAVADAARRQRDAKTALDQANASFKANSREVLDAQAAYDRVSLTLEELRAKGAGLKTEFIAQRDGLQQLRNVARESATDIDALADRQARFTQVQTQTNATVTAARTSNAGYAQSISDLRARVTASSGAVTKHEAAQRRLAASVGGTRVQVDSLDSAFRRFYGGSRQALSLLQRLRGQFLGLAAGAAGFYAVVNEVGEVVGALQKIEAAQSRLVAVNDGNTDAIASDLDFLRRTANRLGIDFGTLSDQYTKFAASTKNTGIEDDTRGIFLAVAEAARVNKLSIEQLNGTLNALSQIAAKGTVQMEELKSQLGDRLPGAIQIMADSLGIGTDELFKLTEQGELSAESLTNFAEELNKRFGKALPAALGTSTTAMGSFQNAVFQARLAFAEAGFEESFKNLLNTATAFIQSADFQKTLESLASIVGGVMSVIEAAVENFRLVVTGVVTLLALRFAPVVIVASRAVLNFGAALSGRATASMGVFNRGVVVATASTKAFGTTATTTAAKTVLMSNAFRSLLVSTGIGAVFVAASAALAYFSTKADRASEAVTRLEKNVDKLRDAHQRGERTAKDYADALNDVSVAELESDLVSISRKIDEDFTKSLRSATGVLQDFLGQEASQLRNELDALGRSYRSGEITAKQFSDEIDNTIAGLSERFPNATARAEVAVLQFADGVRKAEENLSAEQRQLALIAVRTDDYSRISREAANRVLNLSDAVADLTGNFEPGVRQAQGFAAALKEIKEGVPEMAEEMEKAEDLADLKAILNAEGLPTTIEEITARIGDLKTRLAGLSEGGENDFRSLVDEEAISAEIDRLEQLAPVLAARLKAIAEGKSSGSKSDPFGDAVKKLNESLQDDTRDLAVQKLEADNDRLAAILTERANAVADIREEIAKIASPDQLAAFDKLGEKYVEFGNLIAGQEVQESIADAIKSFEDEARAAEEAAVRASASDETRADRLRQLRIEQEQFTADRIRELAEEGIAYEELADAEKMRFDEAVSAYKRATDAAFAYNESLREEADRIEAAEKAQDRINSLLERRTALLSLLAQQQAAGDSSGATDTLQEIQALNNALVSAGENAVSFWQALTLSDDPEVAENARAQIAAITAQLGELDQAVYRTKVTLGDLYEAIASNAADAFVGFLENIANGEDVFKSLGQALQQFVSDTLIQIGKLIVQALILQGVLAAMEALFPGSSQLIIAGARLSNTTAGVSHSGKKGGAGANASRSVPSAAFFGAPRFHEGRLGLRPGEMPAIIERSEDVLTDDNPFHSKNLNKTLSGMKGGEGGVSFKNVNVIDPADILEAALADTTGQQVFMNFIGKNSSDVNAALGQE